MYTRSGRGYKELKRLKELKEGKGGCTKDGVGILYI